MSENFPEILKKIFDCQTHSILTYGSEIWGLQANRECIKSLYIPLYKHLWVSTQSCRSLIVEMGTYYLFVNTYASCIKTSAALNVYGWPKDTPERFTIMLLNLKENYSIWARNFQIILHKVDFGVVQEM